MEKKLLYITSQSIDNRTLKGGEMAHKSNFEALEDVFGKDNIVLFKICSDRNLIKIYWDYLFKRNGYSRKENNRIKKILEENKYEYIYFDGSWMGNLVRYVNGAVVIVFLHNLEKSYSLNRLRKNPLTFLKYRSVCLNEKNIINHASYIFALNWRDNNLLKKYYGKEASLIWPITIKDSYIPDSAMNNKAGSIENNLLFVGSFFSPNIEGIRWFIKKVLPYVRCRLTIVGKGMEKLKYLETDRVKVLGTVERLEPLYREADAVIMPIFSGGGMKVKTAEALMYGKRILATDEALIGYDKECIVGVERCNTDVEFIAAIKRGDFKKYYDNIRSYFLNNYEQKVKVLLLSQFVKNHANNFLHITKEWETDEKINASNKKTDRR